MHTFDLPSSFFAEAVPAAAREDEHPSLFNHSLRSYWHARVIAEREGVLGQLSDDLLFAATVLHELGAGSRAPGRERFEIEGADIAATTLLGLGVSEADVQQVWDAIALHTSGGLAERRGLLPRVVRAGSLADFGLATEHDRDLQDGLHAVWPRMNPRDGPRRQHHCSRPGLLLSLATDCRVSSSTSEPNTASPPWKQRSASSAGADGAPSVEAARNYNDEL